MIKLYSQERWGSGDNIYLCLTKIISNDWINCRIHQPLTRKEAERSDGKKNHALQLFAKERRTHATEE